MSILISILIVLACIALAFFVLIQNPKGGGLTGSFGSLGNQVMGVKQSTDVMEKGTWTTMGIVVALCLVAVLFYPKVQRETTAPANAPAQQQQPAGGQQQGAPAQQPAPAGK